jgi:hypothetical protein
MQFGGVKNIVHTAAVVNDATIAAINAAGFRKRPSSQSDWLLEPARRHSGSQSCAGIVRSLQ